MYRSIDIECLRIYSYPLRSYPLCSYPLRSYPLRSWIYQRDEDHQSKNLPETTSRLGKREEFNHNIVPQQFSNKPQNHKSKNKGEESRQKFCKDCLALRRIFTCTCKSFHSSLARRTKKSHWCFYLV